MKLANMTISAAGVPSNLLIGFDEDAGLGINGKNEWEAELDSKYNDAGNFALLVSKNGATQMR